MSSDIPSDIPNNWTAKPLYEAVINDNTRLQIHECVMGPVSAMLIAIRLIMTEPTWPDGIWAATVMDWKFVQEPGQDIRVAFLNEMIAKFKKE